MANTYRNPILSGFNPDPSICYVEGKGYFVATSSFEFFPGLPIYHSTNLVDWKLIGHAINRRSQGVDMQTVEASGGLWAPTFRYHKGTWYMICSCFWRLRTTGGAPEIISSGFYVKTDDIFDDAKWSDAVYFEEIGFDQDILFDDDGRVYQTVTRFDMSAPPVNGNPLIQSWISEVDMETGATLTEPVLARASSLGVSEGCHILKRDGYYYFFTAEGGTQDGHRECVYRSTSPMGPFEPPPEGVNPLIYNGNHPDIQNTGHMDLIEGDRGWIAVFLGVRPAFKEAKLPNGIMGMPTHLGRETFMAPMEWVDGWPVVNKRKPIELVGEANGLWLKDPKRIWEDTFDKDLSPGWYHSHVPLRKFYRCDRGLALRGSPITLSTEHCPSMVLRKQDDFDLDWSTRMTFAPKEGQEAGAVVWLHNQCHAVIALRGTKDGAEVVFRRETGEEQTFPFNAPGTPIELKISARKDFYEFSYGTGNVAGRVPTSAFIPLFTGVHLGLYAQGAGDTPCLNDAVFEYARWETG